MTKKWLQRTLVDLIKRVEVVEEKLARAQTINEIREAMGLPVIEEPFYWDRLQDALEGRPSVAQRELLEAAHQVVAVSAGLVEYASLNRLTKAAEDVAKENEPRDGRKGDEVCFCLVRLRGKHEERLAPEWFDLGHHYKDNSNRLTGNPWVRLYEKAQALIQYPGSGNWIQGKDTPVRDLGIIDELRRAVEQAGKSHWVPPVEAKGGTHGPLRISVKAIMEQTGIKETDSITVEECARWFDVPVELLRGLKGKPDRLVSLQMDVVDAALGYMMHRGVAASAASNPYGKLEKATGALKLYVWELTRGDGPKKPVSGEGGGESLST